MLLDHVLYFILGVRFFHHVGMQHAIFGLCTLQNRGHKRGRGVKTDDAREDNPWERRLQLTLLYGYHLIRPDMILRGGFDSFVLDGVCN